MKPISKTIISSIRNRFKRPIAFMLLGVFAMQLYVPFQASALTSGPSAPEFSGFSQASTTEMVDLYSGDFKYNIPILNIPGPNGGYPISISYNSGTRMDDEASWVGLGWTMNIGAIQRSLRGVPDDFDGDEIKNKVHINTDYTIGLTFIESSPKHEISGYPWPQNLGYANTFNYNTQLYYNSNQGLGIQQVLSFGFKGTTNFHPSLDLTLDAQSGLDIAPKLDINNEEDNLRHKLFISSSISARDGMRALNMTASSGKSAKLNYGTRSLSFGFQQGIPKVGTPMHQQSIPFELYLDYDNTLFYPAVNFLSKISEFEALQGFNTSSHVKNNGINNKKAYGYLNTQNSSSDDMQDFNRNEIQYSKKVPNLGTSSYTYDIFNVMGQGTGGTFRAIRSDVPILHDAETKSTSQNTSIPMEVKSQPYGFHLGADIHASFGSTRSGDWKSISPLSDGKTAMEGITTTSNKRDFEPYFFKFSDDVTGEYLNDSHLESWLGDKALRVDLAVDQGLVWLDADYKMTSNFREDALSTPFAYNSNMTLKNIRQKRTRTILSFTHGQAIAHPAQFNLTFFDVDQSTNITRSGHTINGNQIPSHHLSEIVIDENDGSRYVYGIPVYNNLQKDVTTSVPDDDLPGGKQVTEVNVSNNSYTQNSSSGPTQKYLTVTETPAYAYSWLLTSVVSSDYIDQTLNGPTDDDFGYWIKFNYKRVYKDYKWRTPYHKGNYANGAECDPKDNMASYSYGEKEIFYIDKIESKTHYAIFYTSERKDAHEAAGEFANSGVGSRALHKLDKIELYAKNPCGDPILLQSVYFEYSYELCPEVNNNDGTGVDKNGTPTTDPEENVNRLKGKLTLKKIYTTFEKSNRGASSPYIFDYGDRYTTNPASQLVQGDPAYLQGDLTKENNPKYNSMNTDRWGSYFNYFGDANSLYKNGKYPFAKFPYTPQDDIDINGGLSYSHTVAHWTLKTVILPTGGKISVEYESDDYANVEDKPALEMFDIYWLGDNVNTSVSNRDNSQITTVEMEGDAVNANGHVYGDNGNYRVYFRLDRPVSSSTPNTDIRDKYLKGIDHVYFKCNIDLMDSGKYDYVEGYAKVLKNESSYFGFAASPNAPSGKYDLGYITLEKVPLTNLYGETHPFRKAAMQSLKLSHGEMLTTLVQNNGTVASQIFSVFNLVMTTQDAMQMLMGYYGYAKMAGFSNTLQLDGKSIIRLCEPDEKKYGGGVRVKKIRLDDNWQFTDPQTIPGESSYGQEYFYDTNGDGTGKSTGVAYEPQIGNEESALRVPINYSQSNFLASTYQLFLEAPLMQQYYPGESVGYSKVTVKSIAPEIAEQNNVAIENTAAPYTVNEFYTPKDFPVYGDETDLGADPKLYRPLKIPGVFNGLSVRMARSQGYSIVTNDMAGKEKAVSTYKRFPSNGPGNMISRVRYNYQTEEPYSEQKLNKLNNKVQLLYFDINDPNNPYKYKSGLIGETFDVFLDVNENKTINRGVGYSFNLGTAYPPIPSPITPPVPYVFGSPSSIESNVTNFRTVVTTKVIHRSGILKSVEVTSDQSTISTENLAYDMGTGDVLLTKTFNEFHDPIYNLNYPAYWFYPQMGSSAENNGVSYINSEYTYNSGTGAITFNTANTSLLNEGDVIFVVSTGSVTNHAHVVSIDNSSSFRIVNYDGTLPGSVVSFTVIRSGNKNLMSASAGSLAFRRLVGFNTSTTTSGIPLTFEEILDANATEYHDNWQTICQECLDNQAGSEVNPYQAGILGNWRALRSYVYNTARRNAANIKEDGVFKDFFGFKWWDIQNLNSKWIPSSTVTKYSPFGFEIENKDPLGIFSSASFGYKNTIVKAITKNARYFEMLFDGFEDYCETGNCNEEIEKILSPTRLASTLTLNPTNGPGIYLDEKHTGKYALGLKDNVNLDFVINPNEDLLNCPDKLESDFSNTNEAATITKSTCECLSNFTLEAGKKYVATVWVKQKKLVSGSPVTSYAVPKIDLIETVGGTPTTTSFSTTGKIIEGWQRIYIEFTPSSGYTALRIRFKNTDPTNYMVYFDDFRIHPFNAMMKSYVYNIGNYKLEAELDENNYATYYIYDQAGNLNKIKKETIDGIKTIKEGRISNFKRDF